MVIAAMTTTGASVGMMNPIAARAAKTGPASSYSQKATTSTTGRVRPCRTVQERSPPTTSTPCGSGAGAWWSHAWGWRRVVSVAIRRWVTSVVRVTWGGVGGC